MRFKKIAAAALAGACLLGTLGCGGGGGEKRGDGPHRAGDASTPEGTGRQEAPVQA